MHAVLLDAFSKSIGTVRSVLNVREKGLSERKVREKGLGRTADRRATVRRCVRCPNCMCFWRAPTTPAPPPPSSSAKHSARAMARDGGRALAAWRWCCITAILVVRAAAQVNPPPPPRAVAAPSPGAPVLECTTQELEEALELCSKPPPGKAMHVVEHISSTPRVESAWFRLVESKVLSSRWF